MAVPVIVCDHCHRATPAHFTAHGTLPATTESQRTADLRAEGWTITDDLDLCPHCTQRPLR